MESPRNFVFACFPAREVASAYGGQRGVLAVQITRLMDSFEERFREALAKEAEDEATHAAEVRQKRETDVKEAMFQRMQQELAMQTGP